MASKADFTEEEWETLQRGLTGTGMLVSVADPGLMDSSVSRALSRSTSRVSGSLVPRS